MTVVESRQAVARASLPSAKFKIDFVDDWKQAAACWSADGQETAFQHPLWFDAWYSAFVHVSPLIAIVSDAATGRHRGPEVSFRFSADRRQFFTRPRSGLCVVPMWSGRSSCGCYPAEKGFKAIAAADSKTITGIYG